MRSPVDRMLLILRAELELVEERLADFENHGVRTQELRNGRWVDTTIESLAELKTQRVAMRAAIEAGEAGT